MNVTNQEKIQIVDHNEEIEIVILHNHNHKIAN